MNHMDKARRLLIGAKRVAVLTGAGISAESGVPTFRGAGGLWKDRDVTKLASPEGFAADPELVWEFYNWRRDLLSEIEPNPGHHALVEMEQQAERFTLITQNVDNLHAVAGSRNILEIHGNTWRTRCLECGHEEHNPARHIPYPPSCDRCGGMLRPAVVWFGEQLDPAILDAAVEATRTCDLFLVVGTSAIVYPAASLAPLAKQNGAAVIVVNIEETGHSGTADMTLIGPSGEVLPKIVQGH